MKIYLTILLLGLAIISIGQAPLFDTITVKHALDSNLIELEIEGYYGKSDYKPIDGTGFYYGKCITTTFKNNVDSMLIVNMPVGSILECRDTTVQDMIVTRAFDLALHPNSESGYLIYAMCGEISDSGPGANIFYDHGGKAEADVVAIAQLIEDYNIQNKIGQYAMWAVRNNSDSAKLKSYGATFDELQMVSNHINDAGLKTKLTIQIPPIVSVLDLENDDNVSAQADISVDEYSINKLSLLLFGACGILMLVVVYLLVKRRKQEIV